MENIDLKLHTVVLLIGPTNSGKSYWSRNHLIPGLKEAFQTASAGTHMPAPVIHYVSSDDIRREILADPNAHKYDTRMMQVSDKAFKTLHQRLETAMTWPHNAQFIVIDTTGLAEGFRKEIIAEARAGQYNVAAVIFDYKDADEYLKHVPEDTKDKRILYKHLEKLRKDVWRTINRDTYDQIFKIKSKDFGAYPISVQKLDTYASFFLDPKLRYDVIGDVHGCLHELKALLQKLGHELLEEGRVVPEIKLRAGHGLVFVGDLIDKGPHSKEVLKFITANMVARTDIKVVWGNHENFVYKYLNKQIKNSGMPEERRKAYFTTTEEFGNPLDRDALFYLQCLAEKAVPCAVHPRFIVTHAPCQMKYLGKMDKESMKKMRGQTGRAHREECADDAEFIRKSEETFSYLRTEALYNAPMHVFGHVSFKGCLYMKNKAGIDTGCAAGGALSAVSIDHIGKPYFCHVRSGQPETEKLFDMFNRPFGDKKFDLGELEAREYGRIMWAARDKISFISGTIAPADADRAKGELESLDKALQYYKDQGVKEVVLQPKYMGSRCNVYLSKNPDECFATSRNGHKIKHIENMPQLFANLRRQFATQLQEYKLIVLDGELMPWHAMGAGLIDEQYRVVECGLQSEFSMLDAAGYEEVLAQTLADREASGFNADKGNMPKEELYKKYGQARGHSFRCLDALTGHTLAEHAAALAVYSEQIYLFGSPGGLDYKPFGILKSIGNDGTEFNWQAPLQSNLSQFETVSEDQCLKVDLENPDDWGRAWDFFINTTAIAKMEGIVVKPSVITDNVAPALKVRGPNYLTLIYGYDYQFPSKYKRLIESKRTGKKMRTSIQQHKIGQRLLDVPRETISEENEEYLQLLAHMIVEEKFEKTLDPRL